MYLPGGTLGSHLGKYNTPLQKLLSSMVLGGMVGYKLDSHTPASANNNTLLVKKVKNKNPRVGGRVGSALIPPGGCPQKWALALVVDGGKVLGVVVGPVVGARSP